MAVYTHLGTEELSALIAQYDVGKLISAKGIAEGVSNSNWLIETEGDGSSGPSRFILTMYERRIELGDLPYFLGLLDHLSAKGCPVPRTIHDLEGAAFRMIATGRRDAANKAVALIEFLPGVSPTRPTPEQAEAVGEVLARVHLASLDFDQIRGNTMNFASNLATLERCGQSRLANIDPALPGMMEPARRAAALDPSSLPRAEIHADLFPDNVLILENRVTGLIDFYFACTGPMALDLAITHAAWCFDEAGRYLPDLGSRLIAGYRNMRELGKDELELLPEIAKGAALRFVASRAEDWLDTPEDALVTRKDPMQFVARWQFYEEHGAQVFA